MSGAEVYIIGIIVLVAWVLGVTAISLTNLTRSSVRALQDEIVRLKHEVAALAAAARTPDQEPKRTTKDRAQPSATAPAAAPNEISGGERPAEPAPKAARPDAAAPLADSPSAPDSVKSALATAAGIEQKLTSRWLVWLGGVALALGGGFLVKVSIDQGWFTPSVRVLLGLALAALLIGAGEWLRRHPVRFA
ncbi:MAG: DUF2339 domain-containing protein, partial [Pseudomonadota bacterium]